MKWFSWRMCTFRAAGMNVSAGGTNSLGGPEHALPPPPLGICKIGFSEMQFPAFPGPELGNRNYYRISLFFFYCMHYVTE